MPFSIRRQDCVNSEGRNGKYIVFNIATKSKVSCHGTREDALAAARIRVENAPDLTKEEKDRELANLK